MLKIEILVCADSVLPLRTQLIMLLVKAPKLAESLAASGGRLEFTRQYGFGDVWYRIDSLGSEEVFLGSFLTVIAETGKDRLVEFVKNLETFGLINWGISDREKLTALHSAIEELTPSQWQAEFLIGQETHREQAGRTVSGRADSINAGLAARLPATAAPSKRKKYKVDERVVWDYDLGPQIGVFTGQIGQSPRHGVFVFATNGNKQFLESYLIKRMQRYLIENLGRALDVRNVALNNADLAEADRALAAIDARLRSVHGVQLADLLSKKGVDCLLTIWNQNVRPEQASGVQRFMASLSKDVLSQLAAKTQENAVLLVIVWADVDTTQSRVQPAFSCVPPVEPFEDTDQVVRWFTGRLRDAKVDDPTVETSVAMLKQRLAESAGNPWDVYTALREITENLRKGRI